MTENEAIDKLNNLHYKIVHSSFCSMVYESEIEALCMAKDCLKEIQHYRAIGTVEEFDNAMCFELARKDKQLADVIDEYLQYVKLGTIEEFNALKDINRIADNLSKMERIEYKVLKKKNTPMELSEHNFQDEVHHYLCPSCRSIVSCTQNYCEECGQALET